MASELSNYLANLMLDWMKGVDMPAAPVTVYVALFSGDPTNAGTGGTEVTTLVRPAGRVAVSWSAISARQIGNAAEVDFGLADAGTPITHYALYDAASAGNMLGSSQLDTARTVGAADPVLFPVGDLTHNYN